MSEIYVYLENAIKYFESHAHLRVTVHDLCGELWKYLDVQRFQHRHALCQHVKRSAASAHCLDLELREFRETAKQWPNGRVHRCHAGLSEIVIPVFEGDNLLVVLFAGPFEVEDEQIYDHRQKQSMRLTLSQLNKLPVLGEYAIEHAREGLLQLGARLRCSLWDQQHELEGELSRTVFIKRYLDTHYAEPLRLFDLAEALYLSEDRVRHVIRESLGVSFSVALKEVRLRAACAQLINSDQSVACIGKACGIPDASCFTRYFKEAYGLTPHQWRKQHR